MCGTVRRLLVPSSTRYLYIILSTDRLGPPPLGIEHVGYGRDVPPPLALQGVFSRASPPSDLVPFGLYGVAPPVCPPGSGVFKLFLRKGDCSQLRVNSTPQDFLGVDTAPLSCQEFLGAHQVFGIPQQRRENPLECMNRAIKYSVLAFWPALHRVDEVIHITRNMGEALAYVGGGTARWSRFWLWRYRLEWLAPCPPELSQHLSTSLKRCIITWVNPHITLSRPY